MVLSWPDRANPGRHERRPNRPAAGGWGWNPLGITQETPRLAVGFEGRRRGVARPAGLGPGQQAGDPAVEVR